MTGRTKYVAVLSPVVKRTNRIKDRKQEGFNNKLKLLYSLSTGSLDEIYLKEIRFTGLGLELVVKLYQIEKQMVRFSEVECSGKHHTFDSEYNSDIGILVRGRIRFSLSRMGSKME